LRSQATADLFRQQGEASNYWVANIPLDIDSHRIFIYVLLNFFDNQHDGAYCYSLNTFISQNDAVNSLGGRGGCGDYEMRYRNGNPMLELSTYRVDTLGSLVTSIMLPLVTQNSEAALEYLPALHDEWQSYNNFVYFPISESQFYEREKELNNQAMGGEARTPASQ
jgi:hypothetical protein